MRSMPHGGKWDSVNGIIRSLEHVGYSVTTLVPIRDVTCIVASQKARGYSKDDNELLSKVRRAYSRVLGALIMGKHRYYLIPHESLVLHPYDASTALLQLLGLPHVPDFIAKDENAKHYKCC